MILHVERFLTLHFKEMMKMFIFECLPTQTYLHMMQSITGLATGHYISERNVTAAKMKSGTYKNQSLHDKAFSKLVTFLKEDIQMKHSVTCLSEVLFKFKSCLKEEGCLDSDAYSSWKLKQKITLNFNDKLVFVERKGKSDLICSSSITIGYALQKAESLREQLDNDMQYEEMFELNPTLDESQILHQAAGIIRREMTSIDKNNDFYIGSQGLNLDECAQFVPNKLYDFVSWLSNSHAYMNVSSTSETEITKKDIGVISICHSLISQSCKISTPITLGLAITVHHAFGSKRLVDELHSLGLSVSYDEVRKFLTSVAKSQTNSDIFVPHGLVNDMDDESDVLFDAAIDNFDRNENTLDGKSTTHAMAGVLYKRSKTVAKVEQIPRVCQKSLSPAETADLDTDAVIR